MPIPNNQSISITPIPPTCMRPSCRCRSLSEFQHRLMLINTHSTQEENNYFTHSHAIVRKKMSKRWRSPWLIFFKSSTIGIRKSETISEEEPLYARKHEGRRIKAKRLPKATCIQQAVTIYADSNAMPDESTRDLADYELPLTAIRP